LKIIIACGSGVATSTVIAEKVSQIVKKNHFDAQIIQCSMSEVDSNLSGAALVVTSLAKLKISADVPLVVAFSYITGIGTEETDAKIENILREYAQTH